MSAVVGVDLSTRAIDLVKLEEDSNEATWTRCELAGKDAWERTLNVRVALAETLAARPVRPGHAPEPHVASGIVAEREPRSAAVSDRVVAGRFHNLADADQLGSIEAADGDFDPVADVELHHRVVNQSAEVSYAACGICGNCWGCDCGSRVRESYWDDVYLVAIEAPYGSG